MFDAKVPQMWRKISWESTTLGFWFTELLERQIQFFNWTYEGRPVVFWMTGLFNPQGTSNNFKLALLLKHHYIILTLKLRLCCKMQLFPLFVLLIYSI